ncbi:flippase [Vibrio parahaemolyticus]|nr:flippase [Vibrio parahaemolyticus]
MIFNLVHNIEFKKYFFNTGWVVFEKIIRMFTALLVSAWVARYLQPEQYGILNLSQSIVFIFSFMSTLGLDNVVIKRIVNCENDKNELLGTAFILKLVGSLLIFPILYVFNVSVGNDVEIQKLSIVIALSVVFQSFNIIDVYFQAKVKSKLVSYSSLGMLIISSFLKCYFIISNKSLIYFSWAIVIDALVFATFLCLAYKQQDNKITKWRFNLSISFSLLRESWPLILSSASIAIAMRIDQLMINNLLGSKDVGIYSAGVKLAEAMSFLPIAIINSIYPKIIENDFVGKIQLHKKMLWIPFILLFKMVCLVALFSGFIIDIIFGAQYENADYVLAIILFSMPFTYVGSYVGRLMLIDNLQRVIFIRQLVLLALNVVLNLMLIPTFGIIGAAFATLTADFIINIAFYSMLKVTRKYNLLFGRRMN